MTSRSAASIKQELLDLRESMGRILGVQTVDTLIDRSVTEIRAAHPIVRAISVEGGELNLDSLDLAFDDVPYETAQAANNALTGVMLVILARLLGKRVAHSLAEQLDKKDLFEAVRL